MKVKICGLTRKEDAELAAQLGAWALGFIFYRKSPRYISPERVRSIIEAVSPYIKTVGVFVNSSLEEIKDSVNVSGVSMVQLHGDETPEFCDTVSFEKIKALQIDSPFEKYKNSLILLDSRNAGQFGGTGVQVDWVKAAQIAKKCDFLLSGGLKPENVLSAITSVRPFGIDVSSGVESDPGKKDHTKLKRFFEQVMKESS